MRTRAVLAVALALFVVGCDGSLTFEVEIGADGTGSHVLDITWVPTDEDRSRVDDPELFHFRKDMTTSEIAAQIRDLLELEAFSFDPGAQVEVTTEGDVEGLRISTEFESYEELQPVPFSSISVESTGAGTGEEIRLTGTAEPLRLSWGDRPLSPSLGDGDVELSLVLRLPSAPVATNADTVDGRTATWSLEPDEPRLIEVMWMPNAKSSPNIALLGLGAVALLTVIAGGWLAIRHRAHAA